MNMAMGPKIRDRQLIRDIQNNGAELTSTLLSLFPVLFTIGVGRVAGRSGLDIDTGGQSEAREEGTY